MTEPRIAASAATTHWATDDPRWTGTADALLARSSRSMSLWMPFFFPAFPFFFGAAETEAEDAVGGSASSSWKSSTSASTTAGGDFALETAGGSGGGFFGTIGRGGATSSSSSSSEACGATSSRTFATSSARIRCAKFTAVEPQALGLAGRFTAGGGRAPMSLGRTGAGFAAGVQPLAMVVCFWYCAAARSSRKAHNAFSSASFFASLPFSQSLQRRRKACSSVFDGKLFLPASHFA
mmetsp:Transcript_40807/g.89229  ORF Transcript_40807/g.89229 Transcript_40807/m.89229 type:complete len:237 (+) Transcript_40807:629-1339(+)